MKHYSFEGYLFPKIYEENGKIQMSKESKVKYSIYNYMSLDFYFDI